MRIFYAVLGIMLYGGLCGVTVGSAQEALRAREQRDEAEDISAHARSERLQVERSLNSCIQMYADAQKVEDRCQRRLRRCLGVEEFGK